eukprot:IDg14984t1
MNTGVVFEQARCMTITVYISVGNGSGVSNLVDATYDCDHPEKNVSVRAASIASAETRGCCEEAKGCSRMCAARMCAVRMCAVLRSERRALSTRYRQLCQLTKGGQPACSTSFCVQSRTAQHRTHAHESGLVRADGGGDGLDSAPLRVLSRGGCMHGVNLEAYR